MQKLLCALLSIILCGPLSIYAMAEAPDTIDRAVYTFNLPKLQEFIEERHFDPNRTAQEQGFECWDPDAKYCCLLDYAVKVCQTGEYTEGRKALVEYLIPLTTNNTALFIALVRALSRYNRADECLEIEKLLLQEAKIRRFQCSRSVYSGLI